MEQNNNIDDILAKLDKDLDFLKDDGETIVNSLEKEGNEKLDESVHNYYTENSLKVKIKFALKYLATTGAIFAVMVGVLNYSAYMQIADNYINKEKNLTISNSLKTSVINSDMGSKVEGLDKSTEINTLVNEEEKAKIISEIDNKTFHSMDKLDFSSGDGDVQMDIDVVPYENRIVIPDMGKNIPMVEVRKKKVKDASELEDVFMKELAHGVVRYPGSAQPGKTGNTFVFGHSSNFPWAEGDYNDVFAKLDNLQYGNKIYIYYNQKKYTYKVKTKRVVNPKNLKILKRNTGKSEITLMTCFPVGTTLNRLIVIGELIEE